MTSTTYESYIQDDSPEVAANTMVCLILRMNYLSDQRLQALEKIFLKEYGFIERLYRTKILTCNRGRR